VIWNRLARLLRSAPPAWAAPASDEEARLFEYDAAAPLDLVDEAWEEREGVAVRDVSWASPRCGRMDAYLVVPQGEGEGSRGGVILLHGMPGQRGNLLPRAVRLARAGAVCLLPDMPLTRAAGGSVTFTREDRDGQIGLIVDLRRGVDLLAARPDVDPRRLGLLGVSYGAAMGALLAGVEPRIIAAVLAVGDGGLVSHLSSTVNRHYLRRFPAKRRQRWLELMQPIEPLRFVGRAAPGSLFFQSARRDPYVPRADARRLHAAAADPKLVRWYDTGHGLDEQAVDDQIAWLSGRLALSKPLGTCALAQPCGK
jgi:dienelactone hydrolase